jgi:hypothetical protein
MNKKHRVIGIFDDDDVLINAVKTLRAEGIRIKDVFSPYPVHGLDHALGLKRTRISICAFLYGTTGMCLALLMMWYMMIHDWPMDIGGKPNFTLFKNLPAFIPVTFESTVLCTAHGMVLTFYLRSKILPGVTPYIPDTRMTDDKLVMEIETDDPSMIVSRLQQVGASEVSHT